MEQQLLRIRDRPRVSAPVYEIANNILNAPALGVRALAMVEALAVEA